MIKKFLVLPIIITILCIVMPATPASAAKFSNLSVRLNNPNANAPVDATICVNPSSSTLDTENKVAIVFPNNFTVNSSTSNWITDTNNLPQGTTAWPGISANATAVSGKSVTFSSSDLTLDTTYCFNVSSSSSNNGSAKTDEFGQVYTLNPSSAVIDQTTYGVDVVSSNQVSVTASVDPQISDLPISISADTAGSNFPQNTTLDYTITYGTNTVAPINLKIQAQWSQGTINGALTPTVNIVSYISGSATNAYNSTHPVVDTVNRTITWTINNIPGGTIDQKVKFQLKTTENYNGAKTVSFDLSARAISGSTVTPDSTVTQTYLYSSGSSSGSSSSTTSETTTPINTQSTTFSNIEIASLSQSTAQILIDTNNNSILTFKYGTSPNSLTNTIKTLKSTTENLISLDKLNPDTDYYFQITATDEAGKTIVSDVYTFKTAVISPIPSLGKTGLIATSKDNILLNPIAPSANLQNNIIVVPTDSTFTIQFALEKPISLSLIQAIVRNKKVLGASTDEAQNAGSSYVNLIEIQPGVYTGKLNSPKTPGQYEIYVRMIDFNGNILEQKLADLIVTPKFSVREADTNNPIENVRVLLYLYNQTTKTYSVISPQVMPIDNPQFSDPNGELNIVLPYGIYRAEISAIGYESKTVDFEIGLNSSSEYPTVNLKKEGFSIFNRINYYSQIMADMISASQNYIRTHASSSRIFNFITNGSLFIFVIITLIAFYAKTHISIWNIPLFLGFKLRILLKRDDSLLILGKIIDEVTKLPISKANVYLENPQTGHIEVSLKTNKLGEFYYHGKKDKKYKIAIMKKGYMVPQPLSHQLNEKQQELLISLEKAEVEEYGILDTVIVYIEDILGAFVEFLIVLGFIFELYFIATFGILKTAPFIAISAVTFLLLIVYVYNPRGIRRT